MPMKYDKLFALFDEKGITTYRIRKDNLISQAALQKLRTGEGDIDTRTIKRLCAVLGCQPGDIMEYVPDGAADATTEEDGQNVTDL